MIKFVRIPFFSSLFYFLICCSSPEIDYEYLNTLLKNEKYEQVIQKIEEYKVSVSNPLELKKLNQLYISADQAILYKKINGKLNNGDTIHVLPELDSIYVLIQLKDSLDQRWYYFDFYHIKSKYFTIINDTSERVKYLLKATEYPVRDIARKINVYMDLAFHYAALKQFETAREWLDKAMRSFNKNDFTDPLLKVYIAYMNGDFNKADSILGSVPRGKKNLNWQRVESFFNLYTDSLSLKNRFRLW